MSNLNTQSTSSSSSIVNDGSTQASSAASINIQQQDMQQQLQQQQLQQQINSDLNHLNITSNSPLKTQFGSPLRTLIRASSLQNLPSHGSTSKEELLAGAIKNQAAPLTTKDKMDLIKYDPQDTTHPGPSSKYDFVKVKVRLEDHYYVLSRFLISRVLNVTQVDAADSVKISLELKKRLVDQGRLTLTQSELENELFTLLQSYGYGAEYIERYRMTTQFHHQRVPLIILISGPKCIGKSWLATQLAERLNLSTVLQTTLVQDLMDAIIKEFPNPNGLKGTMFGMPSDPPIIFKNYNSKDELVADFKKECAMIRHGVDTDIEKCFDEGKAIIIEGPHIDPSLFKELIAERTMLVPNILNSNNIVNNNHNNNNNHINSSPVISDNSNNNNNNNSNNTQLPVEAASSPNVQNNITAPSTPTSLAAKLKPKTKGIIIPFVLSMKESDHSLLVENWLSCSPVDADYARKAFGNDPRTQTNKIVDNLQTIQSYLCQGVPPFQLVEVNSHNLLETLDVLHTAVLKRINDAYSGHVKGFEYES